ncbi:MAG: hypothetical protein NZ853_06650 [Leptospiraceae bacterium]|nr:hypothetical protein [Leptospiraceae bacterium]MDW7975888.1 hypothetical protein [Leptospiraceae bacterium]
MEITIYSDIIKFKNIVVVIEIFKNSSEERFLKFTKIDYQDKLLFVGEKSLSPYQESLSKDLVQLIILNKNKKQEIQIYEIKKELTFNLDKVSSGNYRFLLRKGTETKEILGINLH